MKSSGRGYHGVAYTRSEVSEEVKGGHGKRILKTVRALNCLIHEDQEITSYTIDDVSTVVLCF